MSKRPMGKTKEQPIQVYIEYEGGGKVKVVTNLTGEEILLGILARAGVVVAEEEDEKVSALEVIKLTY